jgi:transcriptional regulator with XRE-family HTH domain
LKEAMAGLPAATVARNAGLRPQMIDKYLKGTMPGADKAIRLAHALDVPVEWLITGETPAVRAGLIAADEADWVVVPHYRLGEFTETGKPEPIETVPLRKDWLNRNARASTGLWITDLPATLLADIGEEGDTILCRDAQVKEGEGTYLYFFDGMPIIRRFEAPKLGLSEPQPMGWEPEDPPGMRIVARVLGTIKLRPC